MKTIIIIAAKRAILIFTLFLGFQVQLVMAESPTNSSPTKNTLDLSVLAPVTPKEATFDDILPEKAPSMVSLAPVAPKEATFDDDDSSIEISTELLREVAPVTPAEADFNDASPEADKNINAIKFRVPLEANFIDF
ncbi:MAG: hypothetical protein D4R97_02080 [Bacteroidetes bacterium]|nr:MAG: hypothetical protein D4R97_02080 [Bacteroidota bacterium]